MSSRTSPPSSVGDQAGHEGVQLLLGAGDVLALVQQRRELTAVVLALAQAQCVCLQHGLELPARAEPGEYQKLREVLDGGAGYSPAGTGSGR